MTYVDRGDHLCLIHELLRPRELWENEVHFYWQR